MGLYRRIVNFIANSQAVNGVCIPVTKLDDHAEFDGVDPEAIPRWTTGQCESETIMEALTRMCGTAQRRNGQIVHYAIPYRMLRNRVQRYHWLWRVIGTAEKHCPELGEEDGISIHEYVPIFGHMNKDDTFLKYGLARLVRWGWIKIIRHNDEDYIAFTQKAMSAESSVA